MRHDHHSQDTGISKRNICRACRCALNINTQEVNNREGDFIDQPYVKLLQKVKALLLEIRKQQRHDQDSQDTGILKRNICRACRCALKRNNNQEVKVARR